MDITGMSEEEYRWFVRECYKNQKLRPGEPVALEPFTISLILTAVSILLSAAAMLLTPKPKDQEDKTPEEETIEGQNVVRRDRFAPKSGFDSFQNVVDMGSVVPIIYCKREGEYGGLRVNTNLLWSQVLSVGGGQFFKGLFLVGEAGVEIDYEQIALGNNTLASYELIEDAEAGRVTLYYDNEGGRISFADYKRGVIANNDPGAEAGSLADIYSVVDSTAFCQALQPSNQVEFGVYGHIGNNFGYKIGEEFTHVTQWQQGAGADGDGNPYYERQNSNEKLAEVKKQSITFTTRCGFNLLNGSEVGSDDAEPVTEGDVLTYVIYPSSEYDRRFMDSSSGAGGEETSEVNNHDVATTIASIQRGFDEMINIGDLYKAGSAIVVCTGRTDEPFVSDVDYDGDGTEVRATFEVISGGDGAVHFWDQSTLEHQGENENNGSTIDNDFDTGKLCSEYSQIFKLLVAAFSVERAFNTIEVGLHSNVGLSTSGSVNFNSLITREYHESGTEDDGPGVVDGSYRAYVDAEYCGGMPDGGEDTETYRKEIKAGRYSAADTRFSFFRILYRDIDANNFVASDNLYAIRSATGVDVYNYLRFIFTDADDNPINKRREFRFMPVSSWEIRSEEEEGDLYAIDAHNSTEQRVEENGFVIEFVGEPVDRSAEEFSVKAFQPPQPRENGTLRLGRAPVDDDTSYVDSYARIAEAFIYDSVSTTASEPEHKISYVNIISDNTATPNYDDMSLVGLNIRSSKELRNLDQLSVYCTQGVIDSHLFPEIFQDLLTQDRYGTGEFFDEQQIDTESFAAAAAWTEGRNYYFDGAISEKVNLRTWGAERARDFLLDLSISGGQFTLNPAIRFDEPEPVVAMFSSGNIIEDTLQVNYLDTQDRLDPIVTVRWREERRGTSIDDRGLFPQIREFSVRRAGVSENAPVIQVDLSSFCTNKKHAEDRAKLECQSKRYITHAVNFKTVPSETGVQAGSIIKLGIETVYYEQPQNGAISNTGEVTSWAPIDDGTYTALIWDGNTLSEKEITITDGKSLDNKNAVFSIQTKDQKAETYKVSAVSFDEDGNVDIEALYWPTNNKGESLMTVDWDKNSEWEIDG